MNTMPMSRLVHAAFPGRNRLATTGDRVEGAVLVVTVLVVLLTIPVAAATGSEIYGTQKEQVAEEQRTRHRVDAVLMEDAPPTIGASERGGVVESGPVPAMWRLPNGMARQGTVQAHYDAKAGATVPIWINENGDLSVAPLTTEGAAINGTVLALLLWSGVSGAMALLYLATRFAHKRIRLRRWASEWERIAPDWTGR